MAITQIAERSCGKIGLFLKKNSSTILTILGAVGSVSAIVMAVKATPKALALIEEAKKEKDDESLTTLDYVKVAWKPYIPAASVCAASLVCMISATILNKKQQAGLIGAYSMLEQGYKKYRSKVIERRGVEEDEEIRDEIAREVYEACPEPISAANFAGSSGTLEQFKNPEDTVLFYDGFTDKYFEATMLDVMAAEYHLNRNYSIRGYASLGEFYEFLGLDSNPNVDSVGWSIDDELYFIDFDHEKTVLDDGLECYYIVYVFSPTEDYLRGWTE